MVKDVIKLLPRLKENLLYRTCFYDNNGRPITIKYLDNVTIINIVYKDLFMYEVEIFKLEPTMRELDIFINDLDKEFNFDELFKANLTFKEINKIMKARNKQ